MTRILSCILAGFIYTAITGILRGLFTRVTAGNLGKITTNIKTNHTPFERYHE
jgi:hypothetical protein